MSHESAEPGRAVVYHLPGGYSDTLRSHEFRQFFQGYKGAAFAVRTRDGWSWSSSRTRPPQFVATFSSRQVLDSVISDAREETLGRIFLNGALDLEGNIFVLLSVAEYTLSLSEGMSAGLVRTIARISHAFSRRLLPGFKVSQQRSWHFAPCPLDLPVRFFEPWLGGSLDHTCARFLRCGEDLDSAQKSTHEAVCRALEIEPGDHLLDVGCGWGTFLLHAARFHAADAYGIAFSGPQAEIAAQRICRSGLRSRCSVGSSDARLHSLRPETFQKIADLGIFEQVSCTDLANYLATLHSLLAPGGMLLLDRFTRSAGMFAFTRSLPPDLLSDSLSKELQIAESAGFDIVRIESLDKDCEETLRVWIARLLDPAICEQSRIFSSAYRSWMLYLMELATCLHSRDLQAHRLLLRSRTTAGLRKRADRSMRQSLTRLKPNFEKRRQTQSRLAVGPRSASSHP